MAKQIIIDYGHPSYLQYNYKTKKLEQDFSDIGAEVKETLGISNLATDMGTMADNIQGNLDTIKDLTEITLTHIDDNLNPHLVTAEQIGAVTSSGMVYKNSLPAVPKNPIAANEYIPYTWEEINAIALSGHAKDWISVGALKSITLNEAILGTTTHDIRVIGINQDNDQSITFQTKNCLSNPTVFGSSVEWIGSTVRSLCQSYYNAFPGKDAIKTVYKGTCSTASADSARDELVIYNDETVFLLSEREFGLDYYSPLSVENSTTSKAECTQDKNFSYSYYTNNDTRIMYKGDTSTSNYGYPWERSRHYINENYVCFVSSDGSAGYHAYNDSRGLAPAFVIGNEELSFKIIMQEEEDITQEVTELITKDCAPAYTYGTVDLIAGESELATGRLYFVYE